ncbi:MAG: undecaprenyl-diphosphate phosphatase [Alphaproteobacteria bacterium]|jgi:undecaprenyl-diphosphatase|nr:MAG: undecaprenyl-diphosphate phosphatase [Alphaproteobacteria bacterium]
MFLHYLTAILLGMIEGVTEFLPISSTGHLILMIDILGFDKPKGAVFEVIIQLGAILAICMVFRERVTDVVCNFHRSSSTRRFVGLILAAFTPAAILGFIWHDDIKQVLFSPMVVCVMLIVGGVLILLIERIKPQAHIHRADDIPVKKAVMIGLCQALAMIPGTSRSGATMMGSVMMKIDRKTAAEFSFLLAIPTMAAAAMLDVIKNIDHLNVDDALTIGVGFLSAFFSALLSVRWLLNFLANHGFGIFAYYRIIMGTVLLILMYG